MTSPTIAEVGRSSRVDVVAKGVPEPLGFMDREARSTDDFSLMKLTGVCVCCPLYLSVK